MKKKFLIGGNNQTLLKDIFLGEHDDLDILTTSEYWEDVKNHISIWKPDAYICSIEGKSSLQLTIIKNMSELSLMADIPVVIITSEEFMPFFAGGLYDNVALILARPITVNAVFANTLDMIARRNAEKKQRDDEEKKVLAQMAALEEANRVKNILVVDDDMNVLRLIKSALEDKYNVSTMISGKMAEKYLECRPCDLILLDYEMPFETGPEVFKKIREMECAKDIPVVFLTGVSDKMKIAEVLMLKPQGYMLKPIDVDKLIEKIEGIVNPKTDIED